MAEFDVIQREGFDEIMQSVANDDDKQFENFARNLLDALELVNSFTQDRYVHLTCWNLSESSISIDFL